MALAATHIRYALDVQVKYPVQSIKKYITGAVYPDSRYKTKIDRAYTHPEDFHTWDVKNIDDFHKGWYSHLQCDELQYKIIKKDFPELCHSDHIGFATDEWISLTAIKTLQDIDDAHHYDVTENLPLTEFIEAHYHENADDLAEFYESIISTYRNPENLNLIAYAKSFIELELPVELVEKIIARAEQFQQDKTIMDKIHLIYQQIIQD